MGGAEKVGLGGREKVGLGGAEKVGLGGAEKVGLGGGEKVGLGGSEPVGLGGKEKVGLGGRLLGGGGAAWTPSTRARVTAAVKAANFMSALDFYWVVALAMCMRVKIIGFLRAYLYSLKSRRLAFARCGVSLSRDFIGWKAGATL